MVVTNKDLNTLNVYPIFNGLGVPKVMKLHNNLYLWHSGTDKLHLGVLRPKGLN